MLPTGSILHGNYRIDSYLSSGGFGNTYVATHILFNETYAIKEFFMKDISERGQDSSSVRVSNAGKTEEFNGQLEKFRKEALRLRKLHNAHIVRVYDLFNENGTAYYVMDYINGENLKERLQRTGQPMDEKEVRDVLEQVLEALQEVHGQGIWHMDLKPANVMIDRAGVVKLIDFGASKQFNSDTGGAVSTSAVAYTNGYAPREQMERSYEKFGPWTDFYALGATLYNLLTLKHPPMPGDIDDDPSPDKHDALPMPAKVTPQMRGLVLWLIKTNRKQRPQNVQQIKEFLNPSLPKHTPPPVINFDQKTLTLNVSGMGTLHVYLNGREIQVPCTFPQQMQQQDYLVTATAQAGGDVMSKEASLRVVIPALKQTALPEISYDPKTLTLNVTGNGEVHVLLNGKEIQVPYTFEKQRQEQSFNVTATAQASGELKSEVANLKVAVPALKQTALPEISYDPKTLTLNVKGNGTLQVLLDGKEIQVPCTFEKQRQEQSFNVTATAQASGELKSEEAILKVVIPALKQTALPEISYDPKTLMLNVKGNGEVHVLLDGKEIKVPYTFEKQRQEQSFNVTATAQASGELKSEVASLKVAVPALKQTATPTISYDSDSLTLNVKGNGTLHVLLNGKEIKVPYTFEQKGSEASYQVTASAQAKGELKSEEATLKVVVPALMVLKEVVDETQIEAKEQPKPLPKDETNLKPEPKPAVNMGKPVPAVNVATPVSKPYESDDEPESKSRKLWPVILAACAGLLLVVGLYALFHNSDSTPTQPEEQAAEEAVEQVEAAEEVKTVENMQVVIPLCADGTSCTYSGPVDTDGMPDGEGTARFDNGDMLEGTFKNGDAEGENCKYYFHSGDRFEGSMQKNTFVKGRYYYQKDGSYFDGSFKDYRPKDGTWYDKNGKEIK